MLVYLVIDLSLLRGSSREENLGKLVASVTRTLLSHPDDAIQFGFSLTDSHVGGYMLSYQLNMVAQGMGIPKNVATTSACDLTLDDLINLLTLVKLVTDKHVVEELNLRTSRNSRSSDIPAVETCKVLHTVLKTTCVHKLQESLVGNSSSNSDGSQERYGHLLIMTPSLGSKDVLHGYVGKDALESCGGDVGRAFLKHLPLSLWKAVGSHRLSCAWLSGNSMEEMDILEGIEEEVRRACPRFSLASLDKVSAEGMTMESFVACTGFRQMRGHGCQEASSKGIGMETSNSVDMAALWEETAPHSSIEMLQMAMAKVMPQKVTMTPLGRKTTRHSNRMAKSGDVKQSVLSKAVGGASKRYRSRRGAAAAGVAGGAMQSRRGQKAMRRARMPEQPKVGKGGGNGLSETPTSTVDQNANVNIPGAVADGMTKIGLVPYVEDLTPCTVEEAGKRIQAVVARIQTQVLEKAVSGGKDASISAGLDTVPLLTATIQKAMAEVAQHAYDQGDTFDAAACRKTFLETTCMPVKDLQAQHRTLPFESFQGLAWTCAVQLLLRLSIATTSCSWKGERQAHDEAPSTMSLSPEGFAAVEDIMHIIVATMSPIPSQGHTLFLKVIKPCFMSRIKDDITNLEKSIWDEEEMVLDGDGGLVDVRIAAESLEESGETPDMSGDESNEANEVDERKKTAVSNQVKAIKSDKPGSTHGASVGTGQLTPAMSADGSGIHGGGTYNATAASGRRGELSTSNLLSRRFNNSKQYKMVVRANPGKSKLAPASKSTKVSANPNPIAEEHVRASQKPSKSARSAEPSHAEAAHGNQLNPQRQVPDTPLGKVPCQNMHGDNGEEYVRGGAGAGLTTPDTAVMKRTEDVIPNTSPREQPAANQIKRIGSIRQPMFDDTTAEAIFKPSSKVDDPAKNTWLSGAIVKRRKPAPSAATRMGDMQNVDSITLARQDTEMDLHKEIMSPLKPRPHTTKNANDGGLSSVHTTSVEEEADDIEVVLSPGSSHPGDDGEDHTHDSAQDASGGQDAQGAPDAEGTGDMNNGGSDRNLEDGDQGHRTHGNRDVHEACEDTAEGNEDDRSGRDGTFDAALSDDEDSMAAKNDGNASDCSSSHLHGAGDLHDITSPEGHVTHKGAAASQDQKPMRSPFDCSTPSKPCAKTSIDAKATGSPGSLVERTPVKDGKDTGKPNRRAARGGRLARMHGRNTNRVDPTTTPTSEANQKRSNTPTRSPITIEDRGSPCKPSPGFGSFSSPARYPESPGDMDYASDTDSCMGDNPDVMVAMKPLMQSTPDKYDSDEEDAAILNAAANGGLSPGDSDKPAPIARRIRRKGLAAVCARGPGDRIGRTKISSSRTAAGAALSGEKKAKEDDVLVTPANQPIGHTQKKLTAPLGKKKRSKIPSIDTILADLESAPAIDHGETPTQCGDTEDKTNVTSSRKPSKGKMAKLPEQGDVVVCFIKPMDAFVRCAIVKEGDMALARRGKGWCLTVDVVPVGSSADLEGLSTGPFTVKLDSTKETAAQESPASDASWYRVDPSSPGGPTIVHSAVSATEMHNKAVKAKAKAAMPRQESSPILRPIDNIVPVAASNPRKRRKLQPTNLSYEGKVLASAEKMQLPRTPQGLLSGRVNAAMGHAVGSECTKTTVRFSENQRPPAWPQTSPNTVPSRYSSLNAEARSVIARAKALLADPYFS